jgi:hypothetical protein
LPPSKPDQNRSVMRRAVQSTCLWAIQALMAGPKAPASEPKMAASAEMPAGFQDPPSHSHFQTVSSNRVLSRVEPNKDQAC